MATWPVESSSVGIAEDLVRAAFSASTRSRSGGVLVEPGTDDLIGAAFELLG